MASIEKAIQIAARAHEGQVDKQGLPYILHPLRVMDGVEGLDAKIVAVLHDVVEDTPVTFDDLEQEGFSGEILAAVRCVTHAEGESYADYVVRCRADQIARRVKLSDLADNTRLSRTIVRPQALDRDMARYAKYLLSHSFLTGQITEEQYRSAMPEFEG
jgi:(p)ppGpp synthase/HD superfamily hydrolase